MGSRKSKIWKDGFAQRCLNILTTLLATFIAKPKQKAIALINYWLKVVVYILIIQNEH